MNLKRKRSGWYKIFVSFLAFALMVTQFPAVAMADGQMKMAGGTGDEAVTVDLGEIVATLCRTRGQGLTMPQVSEEIEDTVGDGVLAAKYKDSTQNIQYLVIASMMEVLDEEVYRSKNFAEILNNIVSLDVIVVNRSGKTGTFDFYVDTQNLCNEVEIIDISVIEGNADEVSMATASEASPSTALPALSVATASDADPEVLDLDTIDFAYSAGGVNGKLAKKSSVKISINLSEARSAEGPFTGYTDGINQFAIYIQEGKNDFPVYCHNHQKKVPDGNLFNRYSYEEAIEEGYLNSMDTEDWSKEEAINVMLAGYPFDSRGLQARYRISDAKARMFTQMTFWHLCDRAIAAPLYDGMPEDERHYVEGLLEAMEDVSADKQKPRLSIVGAVETDKEFSVEFTKEGNVYRTNLMKAVGNFDGSFQFVQMPSEIRLLNGDGKVIPYDTEMEPGTVFALQSEQEVSEDTEIRFVIKYTYHEPDLYYYRSTDPGSGHGYQDLIRVYLTEGMDNVYLRTVMKPGETPSVDPTDPVDPSGPDDTGEETETEETKNPEEETETEETKNPEEETETEGTKNPEEETETEGTKNPEEETETEGTETEETKNPEEETGTEETTIPEEETNTPETSESTAPSDEPNDSNGSGSGSSGRSDAPAPSPRTVIDELPVPLASLPADPVTETSELVMIDDGEVPLAGLPKTGDRRSVRTNGAFVLSGLLGGLYMILEKRRKQK